MKHPDLFTPAPYQAHSETSWEAAERIGAHFAPLQARVLRYLHECGDRGATDEEMQRGLAMNASTQRPRRIELVARGLAEGRGHRATSSGRRAIVWRITKARGG